MATTDLIGAQARTDHTPTAPLSPAGQDALHRLELALAPSIPLAVVRAVTQFETASARTAELSAAMDDRQLTGAEFDSLALAQDMLAASQELLTAAAWLANGYLRTHARYGEYEAWLTHGRLLAARIGLTGDDYAKRQQLPAAARATIAAVDQMETLEVAR